MDATKFATTTLTGGKTVNWTINRPVHEPASKNAPFGRSVSPLEVIAEVDGVKLSPYKIEAQSWANCWRANVAVRPVNEDGLVEVAVATISIEGEPWCRVIKGFVREDHIG